MGNRGWGLSDRTRNQLVRPGSGLLEKRKTRYMENIVSAMHDTLNKRDSACLERYEKRCSII